MIIHQKQKVSNQDKLFAFNFQKKELGRQLAYVIYLSPLLASLQSCETRNIHKHKTKVKIDVTRFEVSNYADS
jgi:hypothetical protein